MDGNLFETPDISGVVDALVEAICFGKSKDEIMRIRRLLHERTEAFEASSEVDARYARAFAFVRDSFAMRIAPRDG